MTRGKTTFKLGFRLTKAEIEADGFSCRREMARMLRAAANRLDMGDPVGSQIGKGDTGRRVEVLAPTFMYALQIGREELS